MRHDSRGRRTKGKDESREMMALFFQLWGRSKTSNRGGVRREGKERTGVGVGCNRPRQISGREFVTSCFPRATETLSIRVHAFPEREREKASSRRNTVRMEGENGRERKERFFPNPPNPKTGGENGGR